MPVKIISLDSPFLILYKVVAYTAPNFADSFSNLKKYCCETVKKKEMDSVKQRCNREVDSLPSYT